jgi:hypothetical protein
MTASAASPGAASSARLVFAPIAVSTALQLMEPSWSIPTAQFADHLLDALAGQVRLDQVAAGGTSGAGQHDEVRRTRLAAQYRLDLGAKADRAYHAKMQ